MTLQFIVNDVLMTAFFGIAAMEITESFLPTGMLRKGGIKTVMNPLAGTVGGVVGPIIMYFILIQIFDAAGSFDDKGYSAADLLSGWGIPTASDISIDWAASVVVFGAGHPAIKYLLLLSDCRIS